MKTFFNFLLAITIVFIYSHNIFSSTNTLPSKQMFIWWGFANHNITDLTNTNKESTELIQSANPDSNQITALRSLLYIVFGITNDIHVFGGFEAQIPPIYDTTLGDRIRDPYNNLGDFTVGLKWRFLNNILGVPISFALEGFVKFPTVQYDTNSLYSLGDRQNDYSLRFDIGYKFSYANNTITNSISPWVLGSFRDGLPPDSVSFGLEYEFVFPYELHLKLYISHTRSVGGYTEQSSEYLDLANSGRYETGILRSSLLSNHTIFGLSFEAGIQSKVYLGIAYSFVFEGANTYIQHILTASIGIPILLYRNKSKA